MIANQTQNISDERLAQIIEHDRKIHRPLSLMPEEVKSMVRELQQRRQADRWIPVEEKLPENNDESPEFVLVSWSPEWWGRKLSPHDDEDGSRADCSGVGTCFVPYLLTECIGKFTHWRPLPAPERTEP